MGRAIVLLLLGILLGMAIMLFLQGKRVDEYYWQKEELKVQLYEATERLKRLEEQHDILLPARVEEVRLEIEMADETFVEPALRRNIYDLSKELIGQELEALPYPLVYNILDERILESEEKNYRLKVKAVIIAETLTYYLIVEKMQEETVAAMERNFYVPTASLLSATFFATGHAGKKMPQAVPIQSRQ